MSTKNLSKSAQCGQSLFQPRTEVSTQTDPATEKDKSEELLKRIENLIIEGNKKVENSIRKNLESTVISRLANLETVVTTLKESTVDLSKSDKKIEDSIKFFGDSLLDRLTNMETLIMTPKQSNGTLGKSMENVEPVVKNSSSESNIGKRRGFIRCVFNIGNLLNAPSQMLFSNNINVGGAEWYMQIQREEECYLGIYLCYSPISKGISYDTNFETCLFGSKTNIIKQGKHIFGEKLNGAACGWRKFSTWADFSNYANGFVDENGNAVVQTEITFGAAVETLSSNIAKFSASTPFVSDVTLVFEGHRIEANKGLLSVYSPYFNVMFNGSFAEQNQSEIEMKDIDVAEFAQLLEVIYPSRHHNEIKDTNVDCLLRLADQFQVDNVIQRIEDFLMGTDSKIVMEKKLVLAQNYRLPNLRDFCIKEYKTIADVQKLQSAHEYTLLGKELKSLLLEKITKV